VDLRHQSICHGFVKSIPRGKLEIRKKLKVRAEGVDRKISDRKMEIGNYRGSALKAHRTQLRTPETGVSMVEVSPKA
jgi:hypothetical protein